MKHLKQQWGTLSTEAKLGIVVMPIFLAILGGLVIPFVADKLSHKTKLERSGVVKIIDVQTGVPLGDFTAHAATVLRPRTFVLVAASQQQPAPGGPTETGQTTTDPGQTTTDPGQTTDPSQTPDPGQSTPDPSRTTDPGTTTNRAGKSDPGSTEDADHDGVPDANDLCPGTTGNRPNGCRVIELRTEPYGCAQHDMVEALSSGGGPSQRCEELSGVVGQTSGGKPEDVQARARAVAAALTETRASHVRGTNGRLEPLGVEVTISVTVTGFNGERAYVTWSLRRANGRSLPHKWLKNRPILKLSGEAERDTGGAHFWVPLPKRPRGPYFVAIEMHDGKGTPLAFAKTTEVG